MSEMHRIFNIREMVDEILSWISGKELATTARVNRIWFFSSLPNLWKRVNITAAFTPLAVSGLPISDEYHNHNFSHMNKFESPTPSPAHWDRFLVYSEHVRVLLGSQDAVPILMNATLWRPRTIDCFFPNLRSLIWPVFIERLPNISLLISPSLENISLGLCGVPFPSFQLLCETLSTRVKTLQSLQLIICEPSDDMSQWINSFNELLKASASTLTQVKTNAFQGEETLQWLRRLPRLRRLTICSAFDMTFDEESEMNTGEDYDELEKKDFGSLEKLTFTGSQQAFYDNFLTKSTLSSLAVVYWEKCIEIDNPTSFFRTVSIACPLLTTLTIGDSEMYLIQNDLPPIIPWTIVRVILSCKLLTRLSLHCCRVSMTSEELVEVLTSRPYWTPTKWEALKIYTADPLSISDLLLYARYCPHLDTLGIHFDGHSLDDTLIGQAQRQINDNPPGSILPQGGIRTGSEHAGPYKFTKITSIDLAYSPWNPTLAHRLSSFLLTICEVAPCVDGWEWELQV
ncbi:hypothetical protein Clacol_007887 [Clathrus columnatus]|uniref:F-box domain-containing protein n=1 Tax=Clathrus columnatus TaxID=1419009 RepID=A0AAV5AL19_9AGAM|nr:hypothetical protein Clacol_007887 [Clathrus columnatus]